jgi:lambda family phage portal protein
MFSRPNSAPLATSQRPTAYLRDTRSGVIAARQTSIREHRDEVRRVWSRAGALAMDLIQNSGRLKGAVDQILADTVGVELTLNPQPDLARLGYDDKERADWISLVKRRWKMWAWSPAECDFRGKLTIPQQADVGLKYWLAFGESTGIMGYMGPSLRSRYGISTGNKLLMVPPHRLVQETNEVIGLYQGVFHDENGRPERYRFKERRSGIEVTNDYVARDGMGRPLVLHAFDPSDAEDVRGLSPLVPGTRKYLMAENLDDATAQTAFLQTILAITLTSKQPSAEAFEALQVMKDVGGASAGDIAEDFAAYFAAQLDRAADSQITVSSDPTVSHLAPGEELSIKSAGVPGADYLPFHKALSRDAARAIGITYGGYTLDYSDATYASTRMETSSLWPVVMRRRERIAAPHYQLPYEHWLEEEIATGRIPLKGGLRAFQANRDRICWATWQGPAKPSADDQKAANASSERLLNGTSSLARECADNGTDENEVFAERLAEHNRYVDAGMRSPYDREAKAPTAATAEAKKPERPA